MVDLYQHEGVTISDQDILAAMREVGCRQGDVIFVHSDVGVFGKLLCLNRYLFLESICNAIKESVGRGGTVIMPTFTYSFCNGDPFDVNNSKSRVGVLSEYFRNLPGVVRTLHPIFSVAIWGKQKEKLAAVGKDSFGHRSIFGKLHEMNGKIVFFGARFQTCTYVHYVEQMHGIPYRYMKSFKGKVISGDREWEDSCTFLVRDLEKDVISDFSKLEKYLFENNLMKQVTLGNGSILLVGAEVFFDECWQLLEEDIYYLLNSAPELAIGEESVPNPIVVQSLNS